MEAEKKRTKKHTELDSAQIRAAYLDQLLTTGRQPASVYKFCSDVGITEGQFYSHYSSFEGLEKKIWVQFLQTTAVRLNEDPAWAEFNSREKILALYFTLFEELKSNRSYILLKTSHLTRFEIIPGYIVDFKTAFENFIGEILNTGKSTGEIAQRPVIDKRYPQLFWLHFVFLLFYWRDDTSNGFEQTDAAIEKSVNLAFDVIGKGAFDSAIDFAKFLFQTKFPEMGAMK